LNILFLIFKLNTAYYVSLLNKNMKKRYLLPLLQGACFMFLSIFLQSCRGSGNLPLQEEGEGPSAITTIEQEKDQEQRLIEEQEGNPSPTIMPELWQCIFSYLDFEGVLSARTVSADWNELITGFRQAGIVGVDNKPFHIIDTRGWIKNKKINFRNNKLKELTPATIPSFAFYHLMGHIEDLPQSLWPYLPGTQVHILYLGSNQIGAAGASKLAKALPATRVHTLDLRSNEIGAAGASELAKALLDTRVHTLHLNWNRIGAAGARELAKALPATRVHTLNLAGNEIGDAGARKLAKALPGTQLHTLNLYGNQIGDAGTRELAKALPATRLHTLYLGANRIGDAGARELAKALPGTRLHTLHLRGNQIGAAGASELTNALPNTQVHTVDLSKNQITYDMRRLLMKQYPHIKWKL
jgi:Ran GTPase-activating protein (RanGAP) involved in mRNA processing and transport